MDLEISEGAHSSSITERNLSNSKRNRNVPQPAGGGLWEVNDGLSEDMWEKGWEWGSRLGG